MGLTGFTPLEVVQMRGMFMGVLKVVGKLSGGVDDDAFVGGGDAGEEAGGYGGPGDRAGEPDEEDDMDMDMR